MEEIWHENFEKQTPIPAPARDLAADKNYVQILKQLRQDGRAVLPMLGIFVVREFMQENSKETPQKMITFSPDENLREYLNPST